jgi:hypothetical protein
VRGGKALIKDRKISLASGDSPLTGGWWEKPDHPDEAAVPAVPIGTQDD